jgi:hypothetical protein
VIQKQQEAPDGATQSILLHVLPRVDVPFQLLIQNSEQPKSDLNITQKDKLLPSPGIRVMLSFLSRWQDRICGQFVDAFLSL